MPEPTSKTIKKLFAVSRNQCAYPGCQVPLVEVNGTVTGEICHIKAANPEGPRYDVSQGEEERHSFGNLILLCSRHHRIIDNDVDAYPPDTLLRMKREHEEFGIAEIGPFEVRGAERLLERYRTLIIQNRGGQVVLNSPGAIQAKTIEKINITTKRQRPKFLPPDDAIASDLRMKTYAKYLIDRYNEFQKADKEKTDRYKYIAIYNAVKREFGCKWDEVPKNRFQELVSLLQRRIDNTILGRIKKKQGTNRYHSFEEHLVSK